MRIPTDDESVWEETPRVNDAMIDPRHSGATNPTKTQESHSPEIGQQAKPKVFGPSMPPKGWKPDSQEAHKFEEQAKPMVSGPTMPPKGWKPDSQEAHKFEEQAKPMVSGPTMPPKGWKPGSEEAPQFARKGEPKVFGPAMPPRGWKPDSQEAHKFEEQAKPTVSGPTMPPKGWKPDLEETFQLEQQGEPKVFGPTIPLEHITGQAKSKILVPSIKVSTGRDSWMVDHDIADLFGGTSVPAEKRKVIQSNEDEMVRLLNERELNCSVKHCSEDRRQEICRPPQKRQKRIGRSPRSPSKYFTAELVSKEYRLGVNDILRRTTGDSIDWSRRIFDSDRSRGPKCMFCDNVRCEKFSLLGGNESIGVFPVSRNVLVDTHCFLSPFEHVGSSAQCTQNLLGQIEVLVDQYLNRLSAKYDCVFTELVSEDCVERHHMRIDCFALGKTRETGMIRAYFKKAMLEGDGWWASQNPKIIEINGFTDIGKKIPRELPYFAVWFGDKRGFVHVIESRKGFPSRFAQDVIATVLESDPLNKTEIECNLGFLAEIFRVE